MIPVFFIIEKEGQVFIKPVELTGAHFSPKIKIITGQLYDTGTGI